MCEAKLNSGQFFFIQNEENIQRNDITFVTAVHCGMKNGGHSSILIKGDSNYELSYINSSHNYNFLSEKSYGTCFAVYACKAFNVEYFNFLHSTGVDIVNTHNVPQGNFSYGNIQNCSTEYIFKYRGIIMFLETYFDKNTHTLGSFYHSGPDYISTKISFFNCHFDSKPVEVPSDGSNVEDNPLFTTIINGLENLEKCPIPSDRFTLSDDFTLSSVFTVSSQFTSSNSFSPSIEFTSSKSFTASSQFTQSKSFTPSSEFTRSNSFSPSIEFSKSNSFSPSIEFTRSNSFSPSIEFSSSNSFGPTLTFSSSEKFTPSSQFSMSKYFSPSLSFTQSSIFTSSNPFTPSSIFTFSYSFSPSDAILKTSTFTPSSAFTPSFTFKPNATKYPDGRGDYERAQVSGGRFDDPPSPAAIGVTAGISVVLIVVAVVLMLIYLRSKQKQLHRQIDLADEFLHDSTEESTSYSYSYYTFEYEYSEPKESSKEYYDDDYTLNSSFSYSDFNGTYVSYKDDGK